MQEASTPKALEECSSAPSPGTSAYDPEDFHSTKEEASSGGETDEEDVSRPAAGGEEAVAPEAVAVDLVAAAVTKDPERYTDHKGSGEVSLFRLL